MVWREINEHLDSAHPTIASETSIAYAKSAAQQAFYPHHDVYRQSRTRRRPQMASNRLLDISLVGLVCRIRVFKSAVRFVRDSLSIHDADLPHIVTVRYGGRDGTEWTGRHVSAGR